MKNKRFLEHKTGLVFELDNVLYPEKDYFLQVYYLFSQFMEYGEQMNAEEMIRQMKSIYLREGHGQVYPQISKMFSIPEQYKLNFELLLQNAKLPLKLLLFDTALILLREAVGERKKIFILTNGAIPMQLNKIRQIEWHGMEAHLEVHFAEETASKPAPDGLLSILEKHQLKPSELLMVGNSENDLLCSRNAGVEYLEIEKLLLP